MAPEVLHRLGLEVVDLTLPFWQMGPYPILRTTPNTSCVSGRKEKCLFIYTTLLNMTFTSCISEGASTTIWTNTLTHYLIFWVYFLCESTQHTWFLSSLYYSMTREYHLHKEKGILKLWIHKWFIIIKVLQEERLDRALMVSIWKRWTFTHPTLFVKCLSMAH